MSSNSALEPCWMKTVMATDWKSWRPFWGLGKGWRVFCSMSRFTCINKMFLNRVLLSVSKHASVEKYIDFFSVVFQNTKCFVHPKYLILLLSPENWFPFKKSVPFHIIHLIYEVTSSSCGNFCVFAPPSFYICGFPTKLDLTKHWNTGKILVICKSFLQLKESCRNGVVYFYQKKFPRKYIFFCSVSAPKV